MENQKIIIAVCDELKKELCKKDAMPLFLVAQNSKGETELMVFNDTLSRDLLKEFLQGFLYELHKQDSGKILQPKSLIIK